jgi:hypothetical protein
MVPLTSKYLLLREDRKRSAFSASHPSDHDLYQILAKLCLWCMNIACHKLLTPLTCVAMPVLSLHPHRLHGSFSHSAVCCARSTAEFLADVDIAALPKAPLLKREAPRSRCELCGQLPCWR